MAGHLPGIPTVVADARSVMWARRGRIIFTLATCFAVLFAGVLISGGMGIVGLVFIGAEYEVLGVLIGMLGGIVGSVALAAPIVTPFMTMAGAPAHDEVRDARAVEGAWRRERKVWASGLIGRDLDGFEAERDSELKLAAVARQEVEAVGGRLAYRQHR